MANMSLMLVNHPEKQLSEAFRLLKSGSKAGFTIWGRKKKCSLYFLLTECLKEIISEMNLTNFMKNLELEDFSKDQSFLMCEDLSKVRSMFKEAGFREPIKMWYQSQNYFFENGEQFYQYISNIPQSRKILNKFEGDHQIMQKLK